MLSARELAPALFVIGPMSPTRVILGMVASLLCPLPFHLAKSLVGIFGAHADRPLALESTLWLPVQHMNRDIRPELPKHIRQHISPDGPSVFRG